MLILLALLIIAPVFYYLNANHLTTADQKVVLTIGGGVYNALAIVGLANAAIQSRKSATHLFIGWLLLALGMVFILLANGLWLLSSNPVITYGTLTPTDLTYAMAYLCFYVAMGIFSVHSLKPLEWLKRALDIGIVLVSIFLGFLIFLFKPILDAGSGLEYQTHAMLLLYPLGDMILVSSVLAIFFFRPNRVYMPPIWIFFGGVIAMCVTDITYCFSVLHSTYTFNDFLNTGWWYADLAFACAGFVQAEYTRSLTDPKKATQKTSEWTKKFYNWFNYFPYLMVAGTYALFIVYHDSSLNVTRELMIGVGLSVGLVVGRQLLAIFENEKLVKSLSQAMSQLQLQAVDLARANQELKIEIEKRNLIQEKLSYDAMHDALTGLSNRVLFTNRLEHSFEKIKRSADLDYAVLFLDMDNFKSINDILGHNAGDLALIELGQRLGKCIRAVDTLSRFGGDEFVILLENTADKNVTLSVANRILNEFQRPFLHNKIKVSVTCSIGIVKSIQGYHNPEDVLRDVDIAMYTAKKSGKGRFEVFNIEMGTAATYQIEVEGELHRAITNKELFLNYQPVINLADKSLVGFEALLRWQHPLRGLLEPEDFIPIAEDSGAINPIGDWVLRTACTQMREWIAEFPELSDLMLSINISGKQLLKSKLAESVQKILFETGMDPNKLTLEITESTLIMDQSIVAEKFSTLRDLGILISVDDFGTGYSTLFNLSNYTIDEIKIANVFAENIIQSQKTYEICDSIIKMAQHLGIRTVIEGIEEPEQLTVFQALGCNRGQGFYLASPMSAEKIREEVLDSRMSLPEMS